MSPRQRPGKKFARRFLPVLLLIVLAVVALVGWIVHAITHPPQRAYIATPDNFALLSERGVRATNETWTNRDGTQSRGWLWRGAEGAPAVLLLHAYRADRSSLLNLAVKINEATNATVLVPDARAHGLDAPVKWTSFGAFETNDAIDALAFLRSLETQPGSKLVGGKYGIYGVEMGAYTALRAAAVNKEVNTIVVDSVMTSPDELARIAMQTRTGLSNGLLAGFVRAGLRLYFLGSYDNTAACAAAGNLSAKNVLLLTGEEAGALREQTLKVEHCFGGGTHVESQTSLPVTGLTLSSTTAQRGETYDRMVVAFFTRSLGTNAQ